MKKTSRFIAVFLALTLLLGSVPVLADDEQPDGYWPYCDAYYKALDSGDEAAILAAGDAMLDFYSAYTMNGAIAAMEYNIYFYRHENLVYEKRGDYSAAVSNLEKLAAVSDFLGFTDMAISSRAGIKRLDPMTEVYVLSSDTSSAPWYGAKYEPRAGAYIGRVADAGGGTAIVNDSAIESEAAVSFYIDLTSYSAADFSWLIGKYDDGEHLLQIVLNFTGEAATAQDIADGKLDANIAATMKYVSGLRSPVFLRIGGEMNLWQMDAALYKKAYIRIADAARSGAKNAALVFSPNFVSYWGGKMEDYYPGDDYADWVGVSLYANKSAAGELDNDMFFASGQYADIVRAAREVVDTFGGRKPIMVTEGGSFVRSADGADCSAFAAKQAEKFYAALDMIYPQIKLQIYSDCTFHDGDYRLSSSAATKAAYASGTAANPTLLGRYGAAPAAAWRKLDGDTAEKGKISISSYSDTVYSDNMNVTCRIDGALFASRSAFPYSCEMDASSLGAGNHSLAVGFEDGAGYSAEKTYDISVTGSAVAFSLTDRQAPAAPSDWANDEIAAAIFKGLTYGLGDSGTGAINYAGNINRQDFCRLVVNVIESAAGADISAVMAKAGTSAADGVFSDTSDPNVAAAAALGIVNGRGDGTFGGASELTRAQAAKMLVLTAGVIASYLGRSFSPGAQTSFSDSASFPDWAAQYIGTVSSMTDRSNGKSVMGGVGNNTFDAAGTYTSEQAVVTALRLLNACS